MKMYFIPNPAYLVALLTLSLVTMFLIATYEKRFFKTIATVHKQVTAKERYLTENAYVQQYYPFCGPYSLQKGRTLSTVLDANVSCRTAPVDKHICQDLKDRYYTHSHSFDFGCPVKKPSELCKLANNDNFDRSNLDGMVFTCDLCPCDKKSPFSIGFINSTTGFLSWVHLMLSKNIEKAVTNLAVKTLKAGNPFLFLKCSFAVSLDTIPQLLVLPFIDFKPNKNIFKLTKTSHQKSFVNINMILIDSVSRPHFYRSLPRTIKYFQKLKNSNQQYVLDFELFHAVKSRTFESLHALFTGELLQVDSEFEGVAVPPQAVGFHKLLKKFKDKHFETLYQEDLCWLHDWGLIRDSGVYKERIELGKRFSALNATLKKYFIDNVGMTHSTCEVFHSYKVIDHFNALPKVCYGGRLQHDFFLDYLSDSLINRVSSPLFSFSVMNVGHEGTGKRIRTFDESLRNFLAKFESQENTINILFSDHGNSYGPFSATSVGRFEIFHPLLFMIIPNSVAEKIGKLQMHHLEINTKKVATLVDLHHTIVSLLGILQEDNVHYSSQGKGNSMRNETMNFGLLGNISPKRGCDDLKLLRGTLCFCEGWKTRLPVTPVHYLMAEHALAMLNKIIIHSQLEKRLKIVSYSNKKKYCEHLQGYSVKNVWQRQKGGKLSFGIDIAVQESSIFSVVVLASFDRAMSLDLQVDSVERLSRYGQFKDCAHPNVNLKFCICSIKRQRAANKMRSPGAAVGSMFGVKTISRLVHYPCFYILSRTYKAGVVFEASNSCWNVSYTVDLRFELTNMKLAQDTVKTLVPPVSVRYLATIIMLEAGFEWRWKYNIDLIWEKVTQNVSFSKTHQ